MGAKKALDLRSVFGLQATVTTSSVDTGGAFVKMEVTAEPGAGVTPHYHRGQEESYQVLEGTLEVLRDDSWRTLRSGESLTVPPDAVHAFRNPTSAPVRFINVHRPALQFEDHLTTVDRLVREGKVRGMNDPRSLIYLSMSAAKYRPDVQVKPPQWVISGMALLGRALGFRLQG